MADDVLYYIGERQAPESIINKMAAALANKVVSELIPNGTSATANLDGSPWWYLVEKDRNFMLHGDGRQLGAHIRDGPAVLAYGGIQPIIGDASVHERRQSLNLSADLTQFTVETCAVGRGASGKQVRRQTHGGQRRSEFVGDHGEEVALLGEGSLSLVPRCGKIGNGGSQFPPQVEALRARASKIKSLKSN